MTHVRPRMTHLFQQLGLDASAEGIETFIHEHQLHKDLTLLDAPYWSEAQRQFLSEKIASDGEWANYTFTKSTTEPVLASAENSKFTVSPSCTRDIPPLYTGISMFSL